MPEAEKMPSVCTCKLHPGDVVLEHSDQCPLPKNPAGWFLWIKGLKGPTYEKWHPDKVSVFPDTKRQQEALTLQKHPLEVVEFEIMSIDALAVRYPLKQLGMLKG